jgi:outer membrane beta-barrel protein
MRYVMLLAALVWAGASVAAPVPAADAPLMQAAGGGSGSSNDDDEDEPPKTTTPAPTGTGTTTPPAKTDDKKPAATTTTTAAPAADAKASEDQMRLVSGAPLFNPNVAVHIVERKEHSDSKKLELVLYPATAQINGKFTQHYGTQGSIVWHLHENFGLQITGGGNWYNEESDLNSELAQKVAATAQAATALLLTWGVMGGVEVTPIYGKFAFLDGTLAHFSIVVNGGAGVGGSRLMLKQAGNNNGKESPATYGDMGLRFLTGIGVGFRLQLSEHFALRLEVRDTVYTARADKVNGCSYDDLNAMGKAADQSQPLSAVANKLSGSCDWTKFDGVDAAGSKRSNDLTRAKNLVKDLSSDVINNVSLFLGASFLF